MPQEVILSFYARSDGMKGVDEVFKLTEKFVLPLVCSVVEECHEVYYVSLCQD